MADFTKRAPCLNNINRLSPVLTVLSNLTIKACLRQYIADSTGSRRGITYSTVNVILSIMVTWGGSKVPIKSWLARSFIAGY